MRRTAAMLWMGMLMGQSDGAADIAHCRWKARVLLLFASAADDPGLVAQHAALADHVAGVTERALVVVDAPGTALRQRFHPPADGFAAVLVGLDGEEKRRWAEPVAAAALFDEIDAMPMRRRDTGR